MIVRFYATLRPLVGGKAVELTPRAELTISTLLDELIERYPRLDGQLLDEQHNLFGHVHVILNGRDTQYLPAGLATPVGETDRIDIFPPVGGGTG